MGYYYHSLRSDIFRVFRNKIVLIGFAVYIVISFYALWNYGLINSYNDYQDPSSNADAVRVINYCDDDYANFVHKCAVYRQDHNMVLTRTQMSEIFAKTRWCPDITVATSEWSILFFLCLVTDIVISSENISYLVVDGRSRGRVYRSKIFNAFVITSAFRLMAFLLIYLMNYALHGSSHASLILDLLVAYVYGLFPTMGMICVATMVIFIVWNRVVFYVLTIPYTYVQFKVMAYLIMDKGLLSSDSMDYTLFGMLSSMWFRHNIGYTILCMYYPIIIFVVTSLIGILFFKRRTLR